jgi:hypothetical protein
LRATAQEGARSAGFGSSLGTHMDADFSPAGAESHGEERPSVDEPRELARADPSKARQVDRSRLEPRSGACASRDWQINAGRHEDGLSTFPEPSDGATPTRPGAPAGPARSPLGSFVPHDASASALQQPLYVRVSRQQTLDPRRHICDAPRNALSAAKQAESDSHFPPLRHCMLPQSSGWKSGSPRELEVNRTSMWTPAAHR